MDTASQATRTLGSGSAFPLSRPSTMAPKKKLKPTPEAAPDTPVERSRSVYGDSHAATEKAMLSAHAHHLWNAGAIDEHMVAELSKVNPKSDVHSVRYTTDYLAAHPDYTGEDADEIPAMQTAMKHRRSRDEAQNRVLEDYRAGRIDLWGHPTGHQVDDNGRNLLSHTQGTQRQCEMQGAYRNRGLAMREEDCIGNASEGNDSSSDSSGPLTITGHGRRTDHHQKGNTQAFVANASKHFANSPIRETLPTATLPSFEQRIAQFRYTPDLLPSADPSTATPFSSPTRKCPSREEPDLHSGIAPNRAILISISPSRLSTQRSMQARTVVPLQPLHGNSDYTDLDYYRAAALCRKRGIPSGGNVHEVRNRLVRDDAAVSEGLPRVMASSIYRKAYKTAAPGEEEIGH
ncbi:uncharacterized protein J4E87_000079 [Alternaria ethzedia]|uniref:uncharacterized protein n=1 Tax=Alternaria ethzedia TaxID=181014 RepID=UPI0020C53B42|nr:uncharacterized protein J4E87_000079 [Alternaria ethzedia]KAI4635130.1 hypothetical protein J4E87_000079 [Alternaria ethzedia]